MSKDCSNRFGNTFSTEFQFILTRKGFQVSQPSDRWSVREKKHFVRNITGFNIRNVMQCVSTNRIKLVLDNTKTSWVIYVLRNSSTLPIVFIELR